MRRLLFAPLLLVLAFGCDSGADLDFASGDPVMVFEGVLTVPTDVRLLPNFFGTVESHDFELLSNGTVKVGVTEVTAVDATGAPVENPVLAVGLGGRLGEACVTNINEALALGESFVIFLNPGAYCVQVARSLGSIPVDAETEYVITVEPGLS